MKKIKMFQLGLMSLLLFQASSCVAHGNPTTQDQLNKAQKESKNVLLIVTDDKKTTDDQLSKTVYSIASQVSKVSVVEMNVADTTNNELISKYRLQGAPTPLVLVLTHKGLLVGGFLASQVTKEKLEEALPTPKYGAIMESLSQSRPVFAIVTNNDFKSDKKAKTLCETAKQQLANKADIIVVDNESIEEQKLISMLNIKDKLEDSFIVTINSQGIMAGRFNTLPSTEELVQAATKVVQSGCAPGGCGPTCK